MCSKRNPSGVNVINVINIISIPKRKPHTNNAQIPKREDIKTWHDFLEDIYIVLRNIYTYIYCVISYIIKNVSKLHILRTNIRTLSNFFLCCLLFTCLDIILSSFCCGYIFCCVCLMVENFMSTFPRDSYLGPFPSVC